MNEDKQYLTASELASRWGFSENTLAIWRHRKKGPAFYRRGYRRIVYKIDDIMSFEQENPGFGAH